MIKKNTITLLFIYLLLSKNIICESNKTNTNYIEQNLIMNVNLFYERQTLLDSHGCYLSSQKNGGPLGTHPYILFINSDQLFL